MRWLLSGVTGMAIGWLLAWATFAVPGHGLAPAVEPIQVWMTAVNVDTGCTRFTAACNDGKHIWPARTNGSSAWMCYAADAPKETQ